MGRHASFGQASSCHFSQIPLLPKMFTIRPLNNNFETIFPRYNRYNHINVPNTTVLLTLYFLIILNFSLKFALNRLYRVLQYLF